MDEYVDTAVVWVVYRTDDSSIKAAGRLPERPEAYPPWLDHYLTKHAPADVLWLTGDVPDPKRMWVVDGKLTARDPGWKDPAEVDRAKRDAALKKAMALGATALGDMATAASLEAEIPQGKTLS